MGIAFEEVIGAIKEANQDALKPILCAAIERFGLSSVGMAYSMAGSGEQQANPFSAGLIKASEMPPSNAPSPLWYGMYPGRVTLLIGETGAGKSSLLLNIAVRAALGQGLYGFGIPGPVRVLYIDPENSGSYRDEEPDGGLCGMKLERIGKEKPDNLTFHDGRGVDLSNASHMAALREIICEHGYRLVILDPIANLFNTDDENSNSEAARQGKALTALSRETGACIVVAHHTGKDTGGNYGRGASARLGAADVGIVFRARGSQDEADDTYTGETRQRTDICRLQIVKDRPNWFGPSSKYLRMAGNDAFELDTFESWKSGGQEAKPTKASQAKEEIILLLQDETERSRNQIHDALKTEGVGKQSIDDAIKELLDEAVIVQRTGERNAKFYQIVREAGTV